MMKSRSLSTVAKRFSTSALVIAMSCWANGQLTLADDVSPSSPGASASQDSPKIDLKKPERSQPVQSTIIANASAFSGVSGNAGAVNQQAQSSISVQSRSGQPVTSGSPSSGSRPSNSKSSGFASASASGFASAGGSASGNGLNGGQAFGNAMASGSIQPGLAPSTSTPSTGTTRATATAGESVSRSTVMEGDKEVTVVSAVTPRQEITIRQSSEDGIELQLKPRSRSVKADEANSKKVKTFKAESLEDFKEKHAKLYPMLEKYLLSEPQNPVVVAATGNDAQAMATKQIEQMIDQNAGNPQLQDALRQSLDAIKSAQ